MDRLPLLKQTLVKCFSDLIRKAQRGYPIEDYQNMREAMFTINLIENFTLPSYKVTAIIDLYIRLLNKI